MPHLRRRPSLLTCAFRRLQPMAIAGLGLVTGASCTPPGHPSPKEATPPTASVGPAGREEAPDGAPRESAVVVHPYAELPRAATMLALDDALAFVSPGTGPEMVWLDEDGIIAADERRWAGLSELIHVLDARGRWPEDAWITTYRDSGGPWAGGVYRWDGTRWALQVDGEVEFLHAVAGLGPWSGGSLLSVHYHHGGAAEPPKQKLLLKVHSGPAETPTPTFTLEPNGSEDGFQPFHMASFSNGELFLFDLQGERARLQRTRVGSEPRIESLPAPSPAPDSLLGYDPTVVAAGEAPRRYLLLRGTPASLLRETSGGWSVVPVPATIGRPADIVMGGGFLWVAGDRGVGRLGNGEWEQVPTPAGYVDDAYPMVGQRLAWLDDQLWIAVHTHVWSTATPPHGELQRVPPFEQYWRDDHDPLPQSIPTRSLAWPKPASPSCTRVFVLLGAKTDESDEPALREALAGLPAMRHARVVRAEEARGTFLGIEAPDDATGRAIVARLAQRLPREGKGAPQLLCHHARTVAELVLTPTSRGEAWRPAKPLPPAPPQSL